MNNFMRSPHPDSHIQVAQRIGAETGKALIESGILDSSIVGGHFLGWVDRDDRNTIIRCSWGECFRIVWEAVKKEMHNPTTDHVYPSESEGEQP